MEVDYRQLLLGALVQARQVEHLRAGSTYVTEHTDIAADLGAILGVFSPLAQAVTSIGTTTLATLADVCQWSADNLTASINAYVEADQANWEDLNAVARQLGISLPAFVDPRTNPPVLGPAMDSAPSGYGDPETWFWHAPVSALDDGLDAIGDVASRIDERVSGSGSGEVQERDDASSYLVPPIEGENFVQDLRWSAGPILGGLDWLAEQLLGYSILTECVAKPFGGDWQAIDRSAIAWTNVGRTLMATASNTVAVPTQATSWQGSAADAFAAVQTLIGAAMVGLSYCCDTVSTLTGAVGTVAKLACSGILQGLRWISEELAIIAAEASVPVVGWVVGAVDTIRKVWRVVGIVRMIYALIDGIYQAVADYSEARTKIVQASLVAEDLTQYIGRRVSQAVS